MPGYIPKALKNSNIPLPSIYSTHPISTPQSNMGRRAVDSTLSASLSTIATEQAAGMEETE
eukprot:2961680-Ditylum_brightwellii.AAC.1